MNYIVFASTFHVTPTCVYFNVAVDGLRAPIIEFEVGLQDTLRDDPLIQYVTYSFYFDSFDGRSSQLGTILSTAETEKFVAEIMHAMAVAAELKSKLIGKTKDAISTARKIEELMH